MVFQPFSHAREYVLTLKLKNQIEWQKYCKSGIKLVDIPSNPQAVYKNDWKGWGDWLGIGYVATYDRKYLSFEEARKTVHSLGLKNQLEWSKYCRTNGTSSDIPNRPDAQG